MLDIKKYSAMTADDIFEYVERLAKRAKTDVKTLATHAGMERINTWRWKNNGVKATYGNVIRLEQAAMELSK